MNYSPFIYAFEQENIAITGEGTLDGQANENAWWPWARRSRDTNKPASSADRDSLERQADRGVPVQQRLYGDGHRLRPSFIQTYRCQNVLIDGVRIENSPMWAIHPVLSRNVTAQNVKIVSHGPNNDGCNPESCSDVLIKNCYFDTGDDCIAIKSGRNADGRRINVPCENVIIQGCQMRDGHGGVVIGSEVSGGIRNVFAEDCVMDSPNLERALRVKTNSIRGGIIENLFYRNIRVGQVAEAVILITFYYEEGDAGEFTPIVRNIAVTNLRSEKSEYALLLQGYKRSPISNVLLRDCTFDGVEKDNILSEVQNLVTRNVYINGRLLDGEATNQP